ncbi:MAG: hypothetical protein A2W93_07765 [Bacteroidetes bacterium GWF2_43_63]|nr:MAG: hypothetical protein A2W94_09620 [Bacteroidetes bacterium GWE2_42_42]OFY53065.1 MAG: hypothetical protein A2W93_07765 [Bacteroidetes bacterium GWF2_43_63]HBG69171.1 hypothetical protein [Bacteroidales bacterium]HCB62558.1 hypothetical protein [Bacteroidales bacterium]
MQKIKLLKVYYLPKELDEGVLYVSKKFGIAGHLCPCGCMNKIITPLGPSEWSFIEVNNRPTLYPSIGNWQLPCRSHYWITKGVIIWSDQWSEERIDEGRQYEEEKKKKFYDSYYAKKKRLQGVRRFIRNFFEI